VAPAIEADRHPQRAAQAAEEYRRRLARAVRPLNEIYEAAVEGERLGHGTREHVLGNIELREALVGFVEAGRDEEAVRHGCAPQPRFVAQVRAAPLGGTVADPPTGLVCESPPAIEN